MSSVRPGYVLATFTQSADSGFHLFTQMHILFPVMSLIPSYMATVSNEDGGEERKQRYAVI